MNVLTQLPGPSSSLVFGDSYREAVTLNDGSRVYIRSILKQSLDSSGSRGALSVTDLSGTWTGLEKLPVVDGINHVVLGVVRVCSDGSEAVVGVGRFVRCIRAAFVARVGVWVSDEVQGMGLGSILTDRLSAAAQERGVERFYCEFSAGHGGARKLLSKVAHKMVEVTVDETTTVGFPIQ